MLVFFLLSLLFSVFFYVQAWKSGMGPRRWAAFGLVFGPLLLPMFRTHQRMVLIKAVGLGGMCFRA